jgi:hypothetical protein
MPSSPPPPPPWRPTSRVQAAAGGEPGVPQVRHAPPSFGGGRLTREAISNLQCGTRSHLKDEAASFAAPQRPRAALQVSLSPSGATQEEPSGNLPSTVHRNCTQCHPCPT